MCLIDKLTKNPRKFRMFTGMTGAEFDQLCTGVQKKPGVRSTSMQVRR